MYEYFFHRDRVGLLIFFFLKKNPPNMLPRRVGKGVALIINICMLC